MEFFNTMIAIQLRIFNGYNIPTNSTYNQPRLHSSQIGNASKIKMMNILNEGTGVVLKDTINIKQSTEWNLGIVAFKIGLCGTFFTSFDGVITVHLFHNILFCTTY